MFNRCHPSSKLSPGKGAFPAVFMTALLLSLATARATPQPYLVKDIHVGGVNDNSGIVSMIAFNGKLYFGADDGIYGCELWVSDGTNAGTYMVKDIAPGPARSMPSNFAVAGGKLFFEANDNSGATSEIYVTDGTEAGTVRLSDFDGLPDPNDPTCSFFFYDLVGSGGKAFFVGDTASHGREMHVSDGTVAGTFEVKDIDPGPGDSSPDQLIDANGTLFFTAYSPSISLWKSNGTSATTSMVYANNPLWLTNVNGLVFYNGSDNGPNNDRELWVSDGTTGGTHLVKDILANGQSWPDCLTNIGGKLYFQAFEFSRGYELWTSDGTEAGTSIVADIDTGPNSSDACGFTLFGDIFLFAATRADNGRELWRSDGTSEGTALIKDICPGSCSSSPSFFRVSFGLAYFYADDGTHGDELWVTDGTEMGTRLTEDIRPGSAGSRGGWEIVDVNGVLFFAAGDDVTASELWALDTNPPPIPAASVWGFVVLFGAIALAGVLVLKR